MDLHECIVIGAGPAGLATSAVLKKKGVECILLEKSDRIADSWERYYDRLKLHTIKEYSHLPMMQFPRHYPRYIPRKQLIDYFHAYIQKFELHPTLNTEVRQVKKEDDHWVVQTSENDYYGRTVVLCTGLVRVPQIPDWKGLNTFNGVLLHSINYKNPAPFKGKNTLVAGMGNSGAEIALDLSEHGVNTFLSVRGPVNIVPRDFMGNPVQRTARILGKLPNWLGDAIGKTVRKITIGDLSRYGLRVPHAAPARQLRETGRTPVLDIGTVQMIRKGKIIVKPALNSIQGNTVIFTDNSSEEIDAIIAATGYQPGLEALIPGATSFLDPQGYPAGISAPAPFEGLYFVGFDVFSLGILSSIRTQSAEVAEIIWKRSTGPKPS